MDTITSSAVEYRERKLCRWRVLCSHKLVDPFDNFWMNGGDIVSLRDIVLQIVEFDLPRLARLFVLR